MAENTIKIKTLSCMEKVFPETEPMAEESARSMLQNEKLNFQIALYNNGCDFIKRNTVEVKGEIAQYVTVRTVELVPATYYNLARDDYYLKHGLGVYPDVLKPFNALGLVLSYFQWKAVKLRSNI